MLKILKDITTSKDGQTHEVTRVVMVINALMLVPVLIAGVVVYIFSFFYRPDKLFDIQTLFTAVLTYEGGVGTLLTTGAAAIFFKKDTSADGSTNEVESITRGKQAAIVENSTTIVR